MLPALLLALLLAPSPTPPEPPGLAVVVPVVGTDGAPLTLPGPDGAPLPVVRAAPDTPDFARLRALFRSGTPQQVLALHHAARALVRHEVAEGRAPAARAEGLEAPVFLLVSSEDGGFARVGLWLEEAGGARRPMPAAGYVVLTATPGEVERGDLEEVFAHELAHLSVRVLLGALPEAPSARMHGSMAVTDPLTALDEGYAEHFQPWVREHTDNPRLREAALGLASRDYAALWLSNVDRALRTEGVRRNLFVHAQTLPARALEPQPDRHALWQEAGTTPTFLADTLRSGQQMVASEGVVATVLYRLVHAPGLGGRYLAPDFYRPFLAPGEEVPAPERRFTPEENGQRKLLAALATLGRRPVEAERPLLVELVEAWGQLFPEEREEAVSLLVHTTFGATVSAEAGRVFRAQARAGLGGDLGSFAEGLPGARAFLVGQVREVLEGRAALGGALGPALWLEAREVRVAEAPWAPARTRPLRLELNTATAAELMALPGVDLALAQRVVAAREARGPFRSVEALREVPGVPARLVRRLLAMRADAVSLPRR